MIERSWRLRVRPILLALAFGAAAAVARAQTTVYVVRHAEKASDANEKDVPLSEEGKNRAERLAAILKDAGITAIYSTDATRTRSTAEPLARAGGRTVRMYSDVAALADQIKGEREAVVLVVGHSNTVPQIIAALGVRAPVEVGDREYDNLFVVVSRPIGEPAFLHLRY